MLKPEFGVQPVRESPHQLEAQPAIGSGIETLGKTDAVVRHFNHE